MFSSRTILAITIVLVMGACSPKTSDRDLQLVNSHQAVEIASSGGKGLFAASPKVVWIDPRSPAEYDLAHIPGAVNLPFAGNFKQDARKAIGDATVIFVYGTNVQDVLGVAASKRLIELRYSEVYTLKGGLRQWARDGNKVDGTDPESAQ